MTSQSSSDYKFYQHVRFGGVASAFTKSESEGLVKIQQLYLIFVNALKNRQCPKAVSKKCIVTEFNLFFRWLALAWLTVFFAICFVILSDNVAFIGLCFTS